MGSNKLKSCYECICIIFLFSILKAFHVQSEHLMRKRGQSVRLKCFFAGSESRNCHYLIWMKVNPRQGVMNVLNIDGQKYTLDNHQTTSCDIIINSASPENTGIYYCSKPNDEAFIGNGIKVTVIDEINVTPSVELFSPLEFQDHNIPLICWATDAVPSQVRMIWVVNGDEHTGRKESVWSNPNDISTEFTQSRFWISKSDWEDGKLCTCIVEAGGKNISKSIRSTETESDVCVFLIYGISCAALFMIFVAVTTVLVLRKGHRIKEMQKIDNRRQNTGKHGKYSAKSSSLTEVQYASLDNINLRLPPQNPLQEDLDLET